MFWFTIEGGENGLDLLSQIICLKPDLNICTLLYDDPFTRMYTARFPQSPAWQNTLAELDQLRYRLSIQETQQKRIIATINYFQHSQVSPPYPDMVFFTTQNFRIQAECCVNGIRTHVLSPSTEIATYEIVSYLAPVVEETTEEIIMEQEIV